MTPRIAKKLETCIISRFMLFNSVKFIFVFLPIVLLISPGACAARRFCAGSRSRALFSSCLRGARLVPHPDAHLRRSSISSWRSAFLAAAPPPAKRGWAFPSAAIWACCSISSILISLLKTAQAALAWTGALGGVPRLACDLREVSSRRASPSIRSRRCPPTSSTSTSGTAEPETNFWKFAGFGVLLPASGRGAS